MEFDLIGIHPFLANTFRRLMLSDVPSMAIEKVFVYNNTSIIQDEVLVHRLGLIPLRADPRQFEFRPDGAAEGSEQNTLEFELKIKCTWNKDAGNESNHRVDDMYKNNNGMYSLNVRSAIRLFLCVVYSKHIKWLPIGDQASIYKDKDVGPIHEDILIAKMRPGHEIDVKLVAVKGVGRDHAKFSPVGTLLGNREVCRNKSCLFELLQRRQRTDSFRISRSGGKWKGSRPTGCSGRFRRESLASSARQTVAELP